MRLFLHPLTPTRLSRRVEDHKQEREKLHEDISLSVEQRKAAIAELSQDISFLSSLRSALA